MAKLGISLEKWAKSLLKFIFKRGNLRTTKENTILSFPLNSNMLIVGFGLKVS